MNHIEQHNTKLFSTNHKHTDTHHVQLNIRMYSFIAFYVIEIKRTMNGGGDCHIANITVFTISGWINKSTSLFAHPIHCGCVWRNVYIQKYIYSSGFCAWFRSPSGTQIKTLNKWHAKDRSKRKTKQRFEQWLKNRTINNIDITFRYTPNIDIQPSKWNIWAYCYQRRTNPSHFETLRFLLNSKLFQFNSMHLNTFISSILCTIIDNRQFISFDQRIFHPHNNLNTNSYHLFAFFSKWV